MWCRRNRGLAALGALLAASLVAGTVFSLAFALRARDESQRASAAAGLAKRRPSAQTSRPTRHAGSATGANGSATSPRSTSPSATGTRETPAWPVAAWRSSPRKDGRTICAAGSGTTSIMRFTPNSKFFASTGFRRGPWPLRRTAGPSPRREKARILRLWDPASGREIASLRGHDGRFSVWLGVLARWSHAGDRGRRRNRSAMGSILSAPSRHASRSSELGVWRSHSRLTADRSLLPGGDYTVPLWDLASRAETARLPVNLKWGRGLSRFHRMVVILQRRGKPECRFRDAQSGHQTATL